MTSLRATIATLQRYPPDATLNVVAVADFLRMERPFSLNALVARIASLPDSIPFHSTIVTGGALGGEVSITLNRDGSYRFRGFMRATGIPSFHFRVGAVVRSATSQVTVAAQHSGKVFGTDTPGDRQNDWDEIGNKPNEMKFIRNLWPDISAGKMVVSRSSELSGVLGTATDIIKDAAEFFLVAETLGASLAICLVIGSELGDAGVTVPGLGGIVGLGVVGGALFIWGPLAIGPAIILGVAAGAIVDAMVKIRRLTTDEENFAKRVFGDTLDFDRIRLTNLVGLSGRPFTMPTIDDHILINIGTSDAMFDAPTKNAYPDITKAARGQLLIHELTHAWQIQHAVPEDGYVPGWLCEAGIREQVFLGKAAYNYGPPGPPWRSFTLEGQAHMVDDWFAGTGRQQNDVLPPGFERPPTDLDPEDATEFEQKHVQMDPGSPYFGYIDNNIRSGVA
jgi:hypothetical protein